ncbi:DUF2147 domain-containing protein [Martelella mediterranea]|uniref:Uncharacterized protein (DUF2147 family) n=1 Tax=Martelella mediterranea TaxID=293089 RepID=A0A4R3NXG9_9HYPH|nr:DUF2147 domain-containing protein [Martelella mediterranea]TCT44937.1 uncharacterized protein (DUF2147 family) [Martelella mediterranea]
MLKRISTTLAAIAALSLSASLANAASPDGTWLTESGKTQVRIAPCGGNYCGTVVWMKTPAKDTENPDPARQSRDLVGSQMLYNLKAEGDNTWKGKLYNFENGKTYTGKMQMMSTNTLRLSGCILGGAICKSQTWRKVK